MELLTPFSMLQADYEQELAVQRSAHRRELTRSKEDLLGLLAQAEAKSMLIDEETIRKRYTKEVQHIKVSDDLNCDRYKLYDIDFVFLQGLKLVKSVSIES